MNNITKICLVALGLLSLSSDLTFACGRGSINIENNGYRDILIAIADDVPEDPELIERIQYVFTEASAFLYKITRQRAYFQNITILVPLSWTGDYLSAAGETFDKSDIVIDLPDHSDNNQPFVIKTTPCGEYGYYMRLTTDYLMDETVAEVYGPYDKVIVHEWSHLRFGVFDEYAFDFSDNQFYASTNGEIQPTKCVYELQGQMVNPKTGGECEYEGNFPEDDCVYMDYILDGTGFASIMYRTFLDHVTEFCDSDNEITKTLHNRQAPNLQNKLCGRSSVWDVLRNHPDFRENNPPREINDTAPIFKVVKPRTLRTVLVLDVSGSMDGCKMEILGQGCSNYISNIIQDGEYLGIVWFNTSSYPMLELQVVNDASRQTMKNNIPTKADGGTSIGGALRTALQMLVRFDGTELGGSLIVVSDGEEQDAPFVVDVAPEVLAAQVTVHSIAVTDNADSAVDELAEATGGLSFVFSDCYTSNAINEAFLAIGELNTSPKNRSYVLSSEVHNIDAGSPIQASVLIDNTLGRNTQFIFDYDSSDIEPVLTSPNGTVYDKTHAEAVVHDSKFKIYRFTIPTDEFESGSWKYQVSTSGSVRIAVTIKSQSGNADQYPIIATVSWGTRTIPAIGPDIENPRQIIYASVSEGYYPVLNADVTVSVVTPDANVVTQSVFDNGAGADALAGDGVYSSYFVQFDSNGRYGVQVFVNSNPATVVNPDRIIGGGVSARNSFHKARKADIPVDQFTRNAAGGSFELQAFTNPGPSGKLYPPGEINDVQVVSGNYENQTATITWTAVGDQLNEGQVTSYDLRMGTDFEAMENEFENQTHVTDDMIQSNNSLMDPKPSGMLEKFIIEMPTKGSVTYFFAVKAVDQIGRDERGPMSNIAAVSMSDFTSPPTSDSLSIGAIIGIVIGILAFAAVIIIVIAGFVRMTTYDVDKKSKDNGVGNTAYTVNP